MSSNELFDTQTRTELHTHLLSLLSADKFLILLKNYYPIIRDVLKNPAIKDTIKLPLIELYNLPLDELKKRLTIYDPIDNTQTMSDFFIPRRTLLSVYSSLINEYPFLKMLELTKHTSSSKEIQNHFFNLYFEKMLSEKDLVNGLIYSEYINMSLEELITQGVKYVEISYSNLPIIQNIYIKKEIQEKIECRFMLCTNRDNIAFHFEPEKKSRKERKKYTFKKDAAPSLKAGLEWSHQVALADTLNSNQKSIIGFDIMGQENSLRDPELSRDPNSEVSFYNKLKIILEILQEDYLETGKMNTFRIHGGETPGSDDNIFYTLTMLKELAPLSPLKKIPPPEIRIGHGVYFNDTKKYFELLRSLNVIVEINSTSNIMLGNIARITDIRYKRYLEEGIPIVIATDGHGLYNTTKKNEDNNARSVLGEYFDVVIATDEYILEHKTR